MATFPPGFLEEVKARASVSDVVGRRVKLIRRGREFVGLSPFNAEKSPSFTVNDAKGFYHCFSSGEHGDVFSFLMKTEGLSFPEAVEAVAGLAGMEVPQASPEDRRQAERAKGLREAVAAAAHFFQSQLRMPVGKQAMDYLKGRGLGDAAIARFRLGYAPADRMALLAALRRDGFDDAMAVEAGLARRGDDGSVFGYFKDRVIFTIADAQGRPIGFGARAMGDAQPKYLNSPDNPLFHKGETLYGLDLAREPAHKAGEIVVVEGYMDVIALAEGGVPNVVAPLGTAVTESQIQRLWRIAPTPVLCMDGDAAGRKAAGRAALRALPILLPSRSLRFALLDGGRDPDDLIRAEGPKAIRAAIDGAADLIDIVWADEAAKIEPRRPEERAGLDKRLHDLAHEIADETVRRHVTQEFRARLRQAFAPPPRAGWGERGERGGRRWTNGARPPPPRRDRPTGPARAVGGALTEARMLLMCLKRPDAAERLIERLGLLTFSDPEFDALRREIVRVLSESPSLDEAAFEATLMRSGLDPTLDRIQTMVKPRGRPSALMGDVADAIDWLLASIEERERIQAGQDMLERARAVAEDDASALEAVDMEATARASEMRARDGS